MSHAVPRPAAFALVLVALGAPATLAAQGIAAGRVGAVPLAPLSAPAARLLFATERADSATSRIDRAPLWAAPIASAIVPGLGQVRLHNDRFVAYMATEAYLLLQFLKSNRERKADEENYRGIARTIARRTFVLTPGATPPDTLWKYYEGLRNYLESGFYTLAGNGVTSPETDTTTFNGHQWLIARQQYGIGLNDPGASSLPSYPGALAYYESRAVKQEYRWSWRNAQLEWDVYKRTTELANDAKRQSTNDLIALIANHILSSIDAFASVRLIQAAGGGMHISASMPTP